MKKKSKKKKILSRTEEFNKLFKNADLTKFWEEVNKATAENAEAFRIARAKSLISARDIVFI